MSNFKISKYTDRLKAMLENNRLLKTLGDTMKTETFQRHLRAALKFLRSPKVLIISGVLLVIIIAIIVLASPGGTSYQPSSCYTVARSNLKISVIEDGNLESPDALDIKSEVEREATILSLIDEGTILTEKDVTDSTILVELDSSKLKEDYTRQQITFQTVLSSHAQAVEDLAIQKKQNESDIKTAELKVKFKGMDMEKYLGSDLVEVATSDTVSFAELAKDERLGGEAYQRKLQLSSNIDLANEELKRANSRLENTLKLHERKYVSDNDLEIDKLACKRYETELQQKEIARDLFQKYEFQKQAEQAVSDYKEAIAEVDRVRARAAAQEAKKKADLESKKNKKKLEEERLTKFADQIKKCIIRATRPGIVVYGRSRSNRRRPIAVGEQVHRRHIILTIPNSSKLAVNIKVHESSIDKIKVGQTAIIRPEAFPDKEIRGKVTKVGILPDTQRRWLNPDLNVYSVIIDLEGEYPYLKPGFSAQVEVLIDKLEDVLMVPIQAVFPKDGKKFCLVVSSKPELREVETGAYNISFVEIRRGLTEGEKVLLYRPPVLPDKKVFLPKAKDE